MRLAIALALMLAGFVAGCTPMAWTRPGTNPETAQADRAECRAIAVRQADAIAFHRSLYYSPSLFRWRYGRYRYDPFFYDDFYGSPFDDPFFLANDLERECLRAKGYSLTPVAPTN